MTIFRVTTSEAGAAFNNALSRLTKYLGPADATEVMQQALRLSRTSGYPESPEQLYLLGVMLEEHELPVVSQIGVNLKVSALLLGAKST